METERLTLLYETSYTVIRDVLHCYAGLAFASRLWKWLANSPTIYRTVLGTVLKQFSGKQSSPFMELFGQLCLTAWASVSYCLGKCVLLLVEMVSKEFSHLWKRF